jgi:uroporphyrinogen decarboxylase
MGHLVHEAAAASSDLIARKKRVRAALSGPQSAASDPSAPWHDSPFLKACRGEPTDRVPIWLMRQAGRYLPEYRQIRAKFSFLEMCKRPDVCAEIMIGTVHRLGVDAAIIFSDLLPILEPMGLELEYVAGDGPVIHNPIREGEDVDRVLPLDNVQSLDFVCETVRQTRAGLPADIPLIGFAGAPFTLASYAIEGGASRNYLHTKTLMRRDEGAWRELMQRLARSIALYLNAQIHAGAQCVQIFDSWAGCLSPEDYRRYVLPYVGDVISSLTPGVPVISFATGNPALLPCLAAARPSVVGVDWRIRLDTAWQNIGYACGVQGNLDPTVLFASEPEVRRQARAILKQAAGRAGHIFNLGHGVLPQTPVDNVLALIDEVRGFRNQE